MRTEAAGMETLLNTYRRARVLCKQALRVEPYVPVRLHPALEFHGDNYCGWKIPRGTLTRDSAVVDIGLGEDISFSVSLMQRYGCKVDGFDPTPRAIDFVRRTAPPGFRLHEVGVAAAHGRARFFLPNQAAHVSGSLTRAEHVGQREIEVDLIDMDQVFERVGRDCIDLLKIDIEGAEYPLLASESFRRRAARIGMICIEFHHRWSEFGRGATEDAVCKLEALGFRCAWASGTTNEEFLFVRAA
jgi:FkbM family methyltransferase